jgi:hypothetical protein
MHSKEATGPQGLRAKHGQEDCKKRTRRNLHLIMYVSFRDLCASKLSTGLRCREMDYLKRFFVEINPTSKYELLSRCQQSLFGKVSEWRS